MIMISSRPREVGKQIKCELAIVFRIFDFLVFGAWLCRLAILSFVGECPWLFAFGDHLSQSPMNHASVKAFLEASLKVSWGVELIMNPGWLVSLLEAVDIKESQILTSLMLFEDFLRCHHSCFHGIMRALNFRYIKKSSWATGHETSRKMELGYCMIAALIEDSGSIRYAFSPF